MLRALGLVWSASRGWTLVWAAILVAQGVLPAATVYLTRALVNSVAAIVGGGGDWATLRPVVLLAVLMGVLLLLEQVLGTVSGWVRTAQSEAVTDYVTGMVHAQSVRLDMAFYDSPEYFDRLHRATAEAGYRPLTLVESMGGLLRNGVTLVAMGAVLLPYGAWLPLALFVSTLPALYIALHFRTVEHAYRQRVAPVERRAWYYAWLVTTRETAAEVRLLDLGNRFRASYRHLRRRLRTEKLRLNRDEGFAQLGAAFLALAVTAGVMGWMLWRTANGQGTLGDLAMFYAAFNRGQGLMRTILDGLGQIYGSGLFLGDLFEFLALEPTVMDPASDAADFPVCGTSAEVIPAVAAGRGAEPSAPESKPVIRGPSIRFRDVHFTYPRRDATACAVDLEVPAGQIAAIVGPNGAGKTTLLRLLCRLYDPDSGSIEVDGVDIRRFALRELRENITVLVQDPVMFAATVAENIAMSRPVGAVGAEGQAESVGAGGTVRKEQSVGADVTARKEQSVGADVTPDQPETDADVVEAARAASADGLISGLAKGYDTPLTTWFEGGTNLSTGEWQRIALARTFFRRAPIVVLDEPTSAMDPWAEAEWLGRLRSIAEGRTVMIITHRFTTAMLADTIHVMVHGRIVESGSHAELLAMGGRYATSWRSQTDRAGGTRRT